MEEFVLTQIQYGTLDSAVVFLKQHILNAYLFGECIPLVW